jgi:hypothetical protein
MSVVMQKIIRAMPPEFYPPQQLAKNLLLHFCALLFYVP